MAAQAQKLVDKGYRYLKIKVHGEVDEDVARVAAIRRQVGDDVHLTIDANQAYSPKDAIAALNRMAEHHIDLVEQPCHRFHHRRCHKQVSFVVWKPWRPIAADGSKAV